MLPQAEAVLRLYQEGVGRSRRVLEGRVRELETKVDKYKVVRGLALLVERRCTFSPREGPPPQDLRRRLFDEAKGAAVTPEEKEALLARLAPEFGLAPQALVQHLWSDLEEEELLRSVPPLDPHDLLRRFNLGQCQTLLFKATQLDLTFGTPDAYREAVARIKRKGLMFTAEASSGGASPILRVEGVVSFLRSTERYGTRLAQLLPDMLTLPGWSLTAKVLYRDSSGRKRHLDFHLDQGMMEYLDVAPEPLSTPGGEPALLTVAASASRAGFIVDQAPPPIAVGGGLEYPDLLLSRDGKTVYVEVVGFWAREWLERKLERTEGAPGPYVVVAPRESAVAAAMEHSRLRVVKGEAFNLEDLKPHLPKREAPKEPPRRDIGPVDLAVPAVEVLDVAIVARDNRVPQAQALELLEARGFVCGGGFAVKRESLASLHDEVAKALPELHRVEEILGHHGLTEHILPVLGYHVLWKGLTGTVVAAREP